MKTTTLGILGGGQLGRMSAMAAARLGIPCIIYTPEENSPASQVAYRTIVADYTNREKLRDFAESVDVISYEFENIPVETVRYLKTFKPVYPDERLLEVSQDRLKEKSFLNNLGIETARFEEILKPEMAFTTLQNWKKEALILKTIRFGYDGKGQSKLNVSDKANPLFESLESQPLIAEEIVDFDCEISVIVARDVSGKMESYGPMRNEHRKHILHRTFFPAGIDDTLAARAVAITKKLAEAVGLVGVLALEMFVTKDGRILANEIAPRTHNSGHWTIDACAVSQFENHVRAVCGLPLGSSKAHSDAEMINLIGDDIKKADGYRGQKNTFVHIYGKHESRPGRKMGHVTILHPPSSRA